MIIALIISGGICLILLYLLITMLLSMFDICLWPYENDAKDYPKLSYKQFIDYYWVNPDKWKLYNDCVEYKCNKKEKDYIFVKNKGQLTQLNCGYKTVTKEAKFSFSFIDQFKYRKFKHDIETNAKAMKQSKLHNESYQILLNGVQEDIDKLRQQSENELNQAMETMKEVKERVW